MNSQGSHDHQDEMDNYLITSWLTFMAAPLDVTQQLETYNFLPTYDVCDTQTAKIPCYHPEQSRLCILPLAAISRVGAFCLVSRVLCGNMLEHCPLLVKYMCQTGFRTTATKALVCRNL